MENRIREAFGPVRADEALLQGTALYVRNEVSKRRQTRRARHPRRWGVAGAAAMLLLVMAVAGYRWGQAPVSYVSIDVNPSVELALNRSNQVVGTYAFNAEGEQILDAVSLRGKKGEEAVGIVLSTVESAGYLVDGALVSISVQATAGRESELNDRLAQAAGHHLDASGIAADLEVFPVRQQVWEQAHGCHMSPAKYLAIQELLDADADATWEEYSHHSIQQIRSRARECAQGRAPAGEERRGHGNGQGRHGH